MKFICFIGRKTEYQKFRNKHLLYIIKKIVILFKEYIIYLRRRYLLHSRCKKLFSRCTYTRTYTRTEILLREATHRITSPLDRESEKNIAEESTRARIMRRGRNPRVSEDHKKLHAGLSKGRLPSSPRFPVAARA